MATSATWNLDGIKLAGMTSSTAGWTSSSRTVSSGSAAWKVYQICLPFPGTEWASGSRTLVTPMVPYASTLNQIMFSNYCATGMGDFILQTTPVVNLSSTGHQRVGSWTSQSSRSASVSGGYDYVLNVSLSLSAGQKVRGYVGSSRSI